MARFSAPFIRLLLLQACSWLVLSGSLVKFLPGFDGPLPFYFETGYVGVGESEDVQLFYMFVKSEGSPKDDPLLLWMIGGPGCSGLTGLLYEIGPLSFKIEKYNGSLPTLILNPHSWSKVSNLLFIDLPVGTGFSYGRTPLASRTSDFKQVNDAYQFLREWLKDHPEFISNPVYLGGHSYVGLTLPPIAKQISDGNEEGIKPVINLKGYVLGNGRTVPTLETNSAIPFAHGMGLISDELYESLKRSCSREYASVDPSNAECLNSLQDFHKCVDGVNPGQILEPKCVKASPKPPERFGARSLDEFLDPEPSLPEFGCRSYGHLLSRYWANDDSVRRALHVREGTAGEWVRCIDNLPYYKREIESSLEYHKYLSTKGYRSLIYSGDHDIQVTFFSTQEWIRSLNYSIVDDWRPWILHGQVSGYTRAYSNQMTFATLKGGGHTAPEYVPAECLAMFQRWILHEPL